MIFRKVHPYERKIISQDKEDAVKTYKNHTQAISFFCLSTIAMISVYVLVYAYILPVTDISIFTVCFLFFAIGFAIKKPLLVILKKLFKDASKGVYFMGFLIVGPFLVSFILLINSSITFESTEEKIKITGYERHYSKGKRGGGYNNYTLQLEDNKFQFQIGFRTFSSPPKSQYINYRFRRGVFGLRLLQEYYFTDE